MSPKKQASARGQTGIERPPALSAENSSQAIGPASPAGNVDQIRDILFGAQMRDYERRFSRLEERVAKEVSLLRDETRKRLDSLETFFQGEMGSLADRLASEQKDRGSKDEQLKTEIDSLLAALESKTAALDEQVNRSVRELRQQLLTQSKTLGEEIETRASALSEVLQQETEELQTSKVDRSKLAEILSQVAIQLTNEEALGLGLETENLDDE